MADPRLSFKAVTLPRSAANYAGVGKARTIYDEDVHAFRILVDIGETTKRSTETFASEGEAFRCWSETPLDWELAR